MGGGATLTIGGGGTSADGSSCHDSSCSYSWPAMGGGATLTIGGGGCSSSHTPDCACSTTWPRSGMNHRHHRSFTGVHLASDVPYAAVLWSLPQFKNGSWASTAASDGSDMNGSNEHLALDCKWEWCASLVVLHSRHERRRLHPNTIWCSLHGMAQNQNSIME